MISALLSLLGSSAIGSLLGGLLAILKGREDLKVKQLELQHEQARWTHELQARAADLEIARVEAQGRKEVAIAEADGAADAARVTAIAASHQADRLTADELRAAGKWSWLLLAGDALLRKPIRPLATVALTGSALYLSWLLIDRMLGAGWDQMSTAERKTLGEMALNWVFAQAAAALSYWFVARGNRQR